VYCAKCHLAGLIVVCEYGSFACGIIVDDVVLCSVVGRLWSQNAESAAVRERPRKESAVLTQQLFGSLPSLALRRCVVRGVDSFFISRLVFSCV
jgi:hypothetical protein